MLQVGQAEIFAQLCIGLDITPLEMANVESVITRNPKLITHLKSLQRSAANVAACALPAPGSAMRPGLSSPSGGWHPRRVRYLRGSTHRTGCSHASAGHSENTPHPRRPPAAPAHRV